MASQNAQTPRIIPPHVVLFNDNIYTKSFTPKEYQVELLDVAEVKDIIICLLNRAAQNFVTLQVVNSFASYHDSKKLCVIIMDDPSCANQCFQDVSDFTSLPVYTLKESTEVGDARVIVTTSQRFLELLEKEILAPDSIQLLVVDQCHLSIKEETDIAKVMQKVNAFATRPRILGLTTSLLDDKVKCKDPAQLEAQIALLESKMQCQVETASDILSILRFYPRPHESIVESSTPKTACSLSSEINRLIDEARVFLSDHVYDLASVYGDFIEELEEIGDPRSLPMSVLDDLQYVVDTMGAWCADRAAFVLLIRVENLKVKTKYERHYILLCMISTLLIKVRALCDSEFQQYNECETIQKFSSHKILRLIEILSHYKDKPAEKQEKAPDEATEPSSPAETDSSQPKTEDKVAKEKGPRRGRPGFRGSPKKFKRTPQIMLPLPGEAEPLCGLVFVSRRFTAQVLYNLLNAARNAMPALASIVPQYTASLAEEGEQVKDLEKEHRKQEEVLKRFRLRECNLLVCTPVVEESVELPKCNLVIRFDPPSSFKSMVQSRGRAKVTNAYYLTIVDTNKTREYVDQWAKAISLEKLFLSRCHNSEPSEEDENKADQLCSLVPPFNPSGDPSRASVATCGAMALVNRYCAKLPSDTFTRLTPLWCYENIDGKVRCRLRLPINSPFKKEVVGALTVSKSFARRLAALELCKCLFQMGELDQDLQPVGKETFLAQEQEKLGLNTEEEIAEEEEEDDGVLEYRPGTTKRRQYYFKKVADALMECRPEPCQGAYLYFINLKLSCPLPEEQNTRGRKIYPPEEAPKGFGILTLKPIPKICPFPIFTRSGEVSVSLDICPDKVELTSEQSEKVVAFLNYTFSSVLRLQKHLMIFSPESAENSYYIVPVKKKPRLQVDWEFLDLIWEQKDLLPSEIIEEERTKFVFNGGKYQDAVVMPWYRNQDQPQYFYVAEICSNLSPTSEFPGEDYNTFQDYYLAKYGLKIQCVDQPLLDVDHTSARLNFLTPRYVNRKGVALPVSSEHTKRNKRENLEQKQILVAELCTLHPFPASLWRQAVCLPCILYRVNGLLLADELRCKVATDINLGFKKLPIEFYWQPLDFGWSLADVLQKSREAQKNELNVEEVEVKVETPVQLEKIKPKEEKVEEETEVKGKGKSWLEIGTWSNEMVPPDHDDDDCDSITDDMISDDLPSNLTMLSGGETIIDGPVGEDWGTGIQSHSKVRYGSPTIMPSQSSIIDGGFGSFNSYSDYNSEEEFSDLSDEVDYAMEQETTQSVHPDGLRIEFKGDHVAEAFDDGPTFVMPSEVIAEPEDSFLWDWPDLGDNWEDIKLRYEEMVVMHQERIMDSKKYLHHKEEIKIERKVMDYGPEKIHRHHETDISPESLKDEMVENSGAIDNEETSEKVGATPRENIGEIHDETTAKKLNFRFDSQPDLENHPGPSPSIILQALTMSNANDGINLERLETIGDSFLKYAITTYLYCSHENIHEGKLSHLRSKQVSNLQLYRLGREKQLGRSMIATKFEPHDNWLPPCYYVPWKLEKALIKAGVPPGLWNRQELASLRHLDNETIDKIVWERKNELDSAPLDDPASSEHLLPFVPYNLLTQHSIPDKSLADCVEALIGAYLIACGPRGALLFMSWLGIRVLPKAVASDNSQQYGKLKPPQSPLLRNVPNPKGELEKMLYGFEKFEERLKYRFRDRAYLLQAMSHASYSPNRLTDCYQRLEFLGDAVLDYLITRYLYEDERQHSPGALTDLRSALVNNAIFAVLAVRHGFHQFFLHLSPGLAQVIQRFVRLQQANSHCLSPQYYVLGEGDVSEAEDIEVPKALGDVFESVAGAIFLDSGMSLDAVWHTYYAMMAPELDLFSAHVPKSPIRELLEREPETAKFGKPEKLADGRRVRVSVEVFGQGVFRGIGRNYRIAKSTAAKCALRHLTQHQHRGGTGEANRAH
ncbi:endoribonuclease Dcr-1 [Neocloeon triangulifer]|uniref:endoribonuclease Dcr-1 n=1 Tax=Neocloeon triangulifer TaxID=2078957 RepID=UPI00286EB5C8|nr:endoribonuclease Dcr-1 [Neocloeon triangulifer]